MPNNNITNTLAAETLLQNAPVIDGHHYLKLPVDLLEIHPTIQRPARGHEKQIAKRWDDRKCTPLIVSYDRANNGKFKILDGQHRYLAAKLANVPTLTCIVYQNLTEAQEAELFAAQRENVRRLTLRDSFRALLTAGNPTALTLKAICDEYNVFVIRERKEDTPFLRSLNKLFEATQTYGADVARYVLSTLNAADWLDEKEGTSKDVTEALIRIWKWTTAGKITTHEANRLGNKLREFSCDEFIANAIIARPHSTRSVAISYLMMRTAKEVPQQLTIATPSTAESAT